MDRNNLLHFTTVGPTGIGLMRWRQIAVSQRGGHGGTRRCLEQTKSSEQTVFKAVWTAVLRIAIVSASTSSSLSSTIGAGHTSIQATTWRETFTTTSILTATSYYPDALPSQLHQVRKLHVFIRMNVTQSTLSPNRQKQELRHPAEYEYYLKATINL